MKQLKLASYIFLTIFIILINILIFLNFQSNYNEQIEKLQEQSVSNLESRYLHITKNLKLLADIYFEEVINQEPILNILKGLENSHEPERDKIRQELYQAMLPIYKRMQKIDFRQVHFHLKDNTSFLRMHTPDIYGDSLTNIRDTISKTNDTLQSQHGFEEGRIYNGFRNVYPIIYNGVHLGSVELSLSFNAVRSMMEQTYENHFAFMVAKDVVDTKVFKDQIEKNYMISYIDPHFYFEKRYSNHEEFKKMKNKFNLLSSAQKETIKGILHNFKSFSMIGKYNDTSFELSFLTIYNTNQKPVAYIISQSQNSLYIALTQQYEKQILFLILISSFIFAFGIFWILNNQKNIYEYKSNTDALTQVFNRTKFYSDFDEVHTKRSTDKTFCLLLIDIDDFKHINDTYGHGVGDKVLVEFVKNIKRSIRSSDEIYRWGGEEFLVAIHAPLEQTKEIANKIITNTQKLICCENIKITCSIGIACYEKEQSIDELVTASDNKMYEAKQSGKNQFKY